MAANKHKAQAYIRDVTEAARQSREKHGLEEKDIELRIRIDIETQLSYNNHEDED